MKKKMKISRRKKELLDLDITSLLDILVILLVFLLKSYNASDLTLNLTKNLRMPSSESRQMGQYAAIIQVNKDKEVFINNKKLGGLDSYGMNITPLKNELELIKGEEKKKLEGRDKGMLKNINIVLDKDLEYADMKKIMNTAAIVGYTNFKFIVRGNY